MTDLVLTETADGCATVTMNRPQARNALSPPLVGALEHALEAVGDEVSAGAVRALVLCGAGKVFSAGMDVKAIISDPAGMRPALRALARVMGLLRRLPVPTITCVQGAAIGAGCGLMIASDYSVIHEDAQVGYLEASLGLSPAVVAPWLIRRIGPGRARAMLLGGEMLSGRQAHDLGLVTHVVPRGRVEAEAAGLAARLAAGSAEALAATKRWLNELEGQVSDELGQRGADLSAEILAGAEAQARVRARFG